MICQRTTRITWHKRAVGGDLGMKIGFSNTFRYRATESDNDVVTRERTQSTEFDFAKLAIVIILAIIAYELAKKGIVVPLLVWVLIEIVLILYAVSFIIQLVAFFILRSER